MVLFDHEDWPDSERIEKFHPKLDLFFQRVKYNGSKVTSLDTLYVLQYHFMKYIPFENLLLHGYASNLPHPDGGPVRIEPDIVEKKILEQNRGGYCFELNQYWFLILREMGFKVTTKMARSLRSLSAETPRARTHLVPIATIDGVQYITDVAFATFSPVTPIRIDTTEPQANAYEKLRLIHPGPSYPSHHYLLQQFNYRNAGTNESDSEGGESKLWVNRFAFDLNELSTYADWETANWMVSTRPSALPVMAALVTTITPTGRCWLIDNKLVHLRFCDGKRIESVHELINSEPLPIEYIERLLTSREEYLQVLQEIFELEIPSEYHATLRIPGTSWP